MSTLLSPFGPRAYAYAQVDVFAERSLEGNMLGIFLDGRGLSTAEMQALARETNLSETTFILPRDEATERASGVRVRIFTVQEELAFAGHPTLGTASWLFWNHPQLAGAEQIVLELGVGAVPVRFRPDGEGAGVFGSMRQPYAQFGQEHERAEAAQALGLRPEDLHSTLPVQTVSTGMPFCVAVLHSLEVLGRLRIPPAEAERFLAARGAKFFYCIAQSPTGWRARMQFYGSEDPATGSAAGCAIAYLVHHGAVPPGQETILEQGVEMLRPSRIHASARPGEEDSKWEVFVGGRTIPVASGQFFLP